MKTISLELSKKLNEGGYLDGIETEYNWCFNDNSFYFIANSNKIEGIKTLTLEEAIDFLPYNIITFIPHMLFLGKGKIDWEVKRYKKGGRKINYFFKQPNNYNRAFHFEKGETLLEAIEKMIEYLLDNNLLGKQ